jgi:hypothetical protein
MASMITEHEALITEHEALACKGPSQEPLPWRVIQSDEEAVPKPLTPDKLSSLQM